MGEVAASCGFARLAGLGVAAETAVALRGASFVAESAFVAVAVNAVYGCVLVWCGGSHRSVNVANVCRPLQLVWFG